MKNRISAQIITLQEILASHTDLPCVQGDMNPGSGLELVTGADVAEPDKYPNGFVHFGAWL